ncbi:MAG TPA: branched-chain amino acid ABC transporter permease, partial [Gemmatimonadetes bacterium]|nr:branched-chain amino acid ABC transporter permease [Gemmatimonadota bacterium]
MLSANPLEGLEQQIVFGIASGSIYASLALALVLIYRAMEAINFAQGEMATFSTFIAWMLMTTFQWSFWITFPLVVVLSFVG